ncbi:MAG: 30S ribosomal protein S6 [Oscillospiraceae bacterium]|nr:30S ribosomal protein S6 [Oscillospiraceae bacterium]MBP1557323.1 30S ribosomal protein S6 [Oscillospiraceae bacterium]MBP1577089.1 30S ribosomal protein S6 [Oscillospiraceae bacterium]
MAKATANYESVVIFSVMNGEENITALTEKFKSLISENGTITNVEEWGKRRLAYPINDEVEGYYLFVEFGCAPEFPAELDRIYKITDGVLRSLIVVKNED